MKYLLLPHLRIINANAWSSTCTIGFPAMTAWMGAVHGLQRKLKQIEPFSGIQLSKMGIVSHSYQLQVYKGPKDFDYSISATANPLKKKGNDFERPPFIEEPRIHLTVSLLIQCDNLQEGQVELFLRQIDKIVPTMKMAGGDILQYQKPEILYASEDVEESQKKILYHLMPGYVLIERRKLLEKETKNGQDSLSALLSYLSIHHHAETEEGKELSWISGRKASGWLVPISVGFQGISSLGNVKNQRVGNVKNQRDMTKPHRFVENVVTLGEFKMPYRLDSINEMMWHYEYDETNQLYVCKNEK